MLSAQEIANYLTENLDAIAEHYPYNYKFSILAEIGKGYDGIKLNGMVRTVSAEPAPLPDHIVVKYAFAVEILVWGPENKYYLTVNSIINEFIAKTQSKSVEFEDGKAVLTFTMGVPKGYQISYSVGENVPLIFTVYATYTENGITSADKHWLLDGVEIPFFSESVSVEREGIPRKIYTEVYSKILLTGQTKFYTFRIPYESNTFKSLQSEILQAPAVNQVVHTLTYFDGEAFTEDNPYTAKVSIYRSANSSSTRPNASAYEITFTDVYSAAEQPLKYFISLIDFPFDMQGDDTRYFGSTSAQTAYFESKAAASSAPFIEIEAPNLDGLVITKQVYRAPNPTAISQFDLVSKNYAIIKVVSADKTLYFYYFITNSTIGADGCVLVDLKLDSVQTYFFREDVTFSDCLIERAHLNRFEPEKGTDKRVVFVTDPKSKIYNAEAGFNFPKRLVQRDKLELRVTEQLEVNNWLHENVAFWVYIFIDPSHEYNVRELKHVDVPPGTQKQANGSIGYIKYPIGFNGAVSCICYPVYKNGPSGALNTWDRLKNSIIVNMDNFKFVPYYYGRGQFEELNAKSSYYYSIKISIVPPFSGPLDATIDSNNNLIIKATKSVSGDGYESVSITGGGDAICTYAAGSGTGSSISIGLFFGTTQTKTSIETYSYQLPGNGKYLKSEIIEQKAPSIRFNPKLNSQNFKELVVTASSGDTFAYDIQKLGKSSIVFEYSEPITPEVTKYYMRVRGGTGLYNEGTDENYTGLVGSTDNSLAYANSQYAAFIANNKNFYLQSNMKIVTSGIKSAMGVGSSIASGNRAANEGHASTAAGSYNSAITGVISAGLDIATSIIDRDMTLDNLKAAPDQLKNANGNVIFNLFATELGLYVERHEALEGDLETANQFMNLYGFTFNSVANVRDYVHIRSQHNYIRAQLQSINGNLSNVARADLRQRVADGIRFWNQDNISYQYENYEIWLESKEATSFEEWLESQQTIDNSKLVS